MARQVANVDIQLDTFGSWIARTNQLLEAFSSEVLTANSTSGITGTPTNKRNSTLYGRFNTNTFYSSETFQVGDGIYANTTSFTFGPNIKIIANNTIGTTGQILAIGTTGLYWTNSGLGTVTKVQGGDGLSGEVTTTGSLSVKAGTGISVSTGGVSVNSAYIATLNSANAATLQSKTWQSPSAIGSSVANTGAFTTLTSTSYSITGDNFFTLSNTVFRTLGYIESTTPAAGTYGGINLRAASGGTAKLKITDYLAEATYGTATINNIGNWEWSNSISATSASLAKSLSVSTDNTSGGGIILSGDGDIVDLNDGFASHRFTNGVKIYSANKGGTGAITLGSNGTINAKEILIPSTNYVKLSDFSNNSVFGTDDVTMSNYPFSIIGGTAKGYTMLPNGLIIQWGNDGTVFFGEGAVNVYYKIRFPNKVLSVVASPRGSDNVNNDMWVQVPFIYENYFKLFYSASSGGNSGYGYRYIAIGW